MKKVYLCFLGLCLALCLIPSAGMLLRPTEKSAENRVLASFPALTEGKGPNLDFFQELEAYFTDHFAFRNELVFADSVIQADLFRVSANEKVVCGTDGWLYYASTLPDFLGGEDLTDREILSLAHNLALTEDYVKGRGAKLLLAFPPNKNTLYGGHMPYFYRPAGRPHNLERLQAELERRELPYADLLGALGAEEDVLYHRQDSHWNNRGALLAWTRMMDRLPVAHEDFAALPVTRALDHEGDLSRMLFTFYGKRGAEYHYDLDGRYRVVKTAGQTGDAWIETAGPAGRGTLLMFRDSFGDALLPFFAASFERACFTKELPYGLAALMDEVGPDAVVIEKAERNLANYLDYPPIFPAPAAELNGEIAEKPGAVTVGMSTLENDPRYVVVRGDAGALPLGDGDRFYLELGGTAYACFHTRGNGFLLYLEKTALPGGELPARVLLESGGALTAVWSGSLLEEAAL